MQSKIICGIQQLGIGNINTTEAWKWYRKNFGMDIPVFDEAAVADKMLRYTGGQPHKRRAILAINMQGGGGFEIWQYTERTPVPPNFELQLGDLGIFVGKIKSKNVKATYDLFSERKLNILGPIEKDPAGNDTFFLKDLHGNIFQIEPFQNWFSQRNDLTGGITGAIIGVTDIEKARKLYSNILGYDKIIYDKEGIFDDFKNLPGGSGKFRRVLLARTQPHQGAFSRLLGESHLELVITYDRSPQKIFKDRLWGDIGFIQICFDVARMDALREECKANGFPFTVDTGSSFDMGDAAGCFAYVEDPDGTLIEFVETHKVPVLKKFGLYFNLKKRDPEKPLPDWMVKTLGFNRVKE